MAGVKGRSGTNKGKDTPWADALRLAAMGKTADGFLKLRKIAEQCIEAAMAGDIQAIKEVGDRLDGKPKQAIEHSGEITRYVARMPEKAPNATQWQQQHAPAQTQH